MRFIEKSQKEFLSDAKEYLRKHQLFAAGNKTPPAQNLGLVVVIPAYDEHDIQPLQSLSECDSPGCDVEIVVVFNAPTDATPQVKNLNRRTARVVTLWAAHTLPSWQTLIVLEHNDLGERHAGVGTARKIGMDEAIHRFVSAGQDNGIIASLDADCRVSSNYLVSLVEFFRIRSECPAATVYFEHQTVGLSKLVRSAIIEYELFLRCYVQALRFSKYPAAFHTIGSCMAVRANSYVRRGGMNRRQAGEDFYFLHKLTALGVIGDITDVVVYPSPRVSHRTPFGTGHAVQQHQSRRQQTYAPEIFADLNMMITQVDEYREHDPDTLDLPGCIRTYLKHIDFKQGLRNIRENTASQSSFRKRFFQWFDGLQVLKLVHHLSETEYPRVPIRLGAMGLLRQRGMAVDENCQSDALLGVFRRLDRGDRDAFFQDSIT